MLVLNFPLCGGSTQKVIQVQHYKRLAQLALSGKDWCLVPWLPKRLKS